MQQIAVSQKNIAADELPLSLSLPDQEDLASQDGALFQQSLNDAKQQSITNKEKDVIAETESIPSEDNLTSTSDKTLNSGDSSKYESTKDIDRTPKDRDDAQISEQKVEEKELLETPRAVTSTEDIVREDRAKVELADINDDQAEIDWVNYVSQSKESLNPERLKVEIPKESADRIVNNLDPEPGDYVEMVQVDIGQDKKALYELTPSIIPENKPTVITDKIRDASSLISQEISKAYPHKSKAIDIYYQPLTSAAEVENTAPYKNALAAESSIEIEKVDNNNLTALELNVKPTAKVLTSQPQVGVDQKFKNPDVNKQVIIQIPIISQSGIKDGKAVTEPVYQFPVEPGVLEKIGQNLNAESVHQEIKSLAQNLVSKIQTQEQQNVSSVQSEQPRRIDLNIDVDAEQRLSAQTLTTLIEESLVTVEDKSVQKTAMPMTSSVITSETLSSNTTKTQESKPSEIRDITKIPIKLDALASQMSELELSEKQLEAAVQHIVSVLPEMKERNDVTAQLRVNILNAVQEMKLQAKDGHIPALSLKDIVEKAIDGASLLMNQDQMNALQTQVGKVEQLISVSSSITDLFVKANQGPIRGVNAESQSTASSNDSLKASENLFVNALDKAGNEGAVQQAEQKTNAVNMSQANDKPVPLNTPNGAKEMADKIRWMVGAKIASADIRLDPPELGSMQVRVNLSGDVASVSFIVQSTQARDLLADATPRLREMLSEQGINLGDSFVAQQDQQQQNGENQQGEGNGQYAAESLEDISIDETENLNSVGSSSSNGIDAYV